MTVKRNNPVQQVMDEYVVWGGPIVTRAVAYADAIASGFTAHEADYMAFGRNSVPAPSDPAAQHGVLRSDRGHLMSADIRTHVYRPLPTPKAHCSKCLGTERSEFCKETK